MSLVSCVFAQMYNTRRQSDAEMGMSMTANRMMNRVRNAGNLGFGMGSLRLMHEQEKNDMARLQMLSLQRSASQAMSESFGKMAKENIKTSFNLFA